MPREIVRRFTARSRHARSSRCLDAACPSSSDQRASRPHSSRLAGPRFIFRSDVPDAFEALLAALAILAPVMRLLARGAPSAPC